MTHQGGTDDPISAASDIIVVTDRRTAESGARASTARARPRLSVGHLLVWVGCCAVFLGLARAMATQPSGSLGMIFLTLVAMGYGAAWVGLLITVARTMSGAPWSIEPGQWLLAIVGIIAGVEVLGEILSPNWLRSPTGVVEASATCALIMPLLDKRLAARWKWLFGALAIVYALPLVTAVLIGQLDLPNAIGRAMANLTPQVSMAITAAAAVALSLFDRFRETAVERQPERPGWLHWTGIATAVWLATLPAAGRWLLGG